VRGVHAQVEGALSFLCNDALYCYGMYARGLTAYPSCPESFLVIIPKAGDCQRQKEARTEKLWKRELSVTQELQSDLD
jgi:hypothetical protein